MKKIIIGLFSILLAAQLKAQSWQAAAPNIYFTGGNVGIGTTTPQSFLSIGIFQGPALTIGNPSWPNTQILATAWDQTNGDYTDLRVPGGTANTALLRLTRLGYTGVGTTTPQSYLSIGTYQGPTLTIGNPSWPNTQIMATGWDQTNGDYTDLTVPGGTANTALLRLNRLGNVLIGKTSQTNTSYILDVNGSARMNKVVVNTTGADYVFDPGYRLPSLPDLEKYIKANRHLPGIAPARQMKEQGMDMGDIQTRLLQKIEEIMLYTIEQQKQIERQQMQIALLREENKKMKRFIHRH